MTLARWYRPQSVTRPSFNRLSNLQAELEQLFEAPLSALARAPHLLNGWGPAVDLYEDKDSLVVTAELPGVKREEIDVSLRDGTLTISGERKHAEKHGEGETYRSERFYGRFQRTIQLPTPVEGDKVKASYKDGVLTVTLPKTEAAKPKQIEVNVK